MNSAITAKTNEFSLRGFMLLPPSEIPGYRGVDRNPFEPELIEEEMDPTASVREDESRPWVFYPPGWRQDAYRLYEENRIAEWVEGELLANREAAIEIQRVIEPHLGPHEVVECELRAVDALAWARRTEETGFLGYDIAYPGGDYYSAVLNGLLWTPRSREAEELHRGYGVLLNEHGLFPDTQLISEYLGRFRESVRSEETSEFCVYRLVAHEE